MIALGADHGGYRLKEAVKAYLEEKGIPYKDFGTDSEESVNYGPYAYRVAQSIVSGECEKGVLCCGTEFCAEMTRRHNDANILAMGGRVIDEKTAVKLADIFLNTPFEGGRHLERIQQIAAIENGEKL